MIGIGCLFCRKIIREHTRKIFGKTINKKRSFVIKKIGTTYMLSFCSDRCRDLHNLRKIDARNFTQKVRKTFLKNNPMCFSSRCQKKTTIIHHVIATFNNGPNDLKNLRGLCYYHFRMVSGVGITINGKYRRFKPLLKKQLHIELMDSIK